MRVTQLKQILAIEKYGSITRAAEALFISQPSLSSALSELEAEIGVQLFRRTNRGVLPTAEGEAILSEAREIIRRFQRIESFAATGQEASGEIILSVTPAYWFLIPDICRRFRQQCPKVNLKFYQMNTMPNIIDGLNKKFFPISLSGFDANWLDALPDDHFISLPLGELERRVFLNAAHPLSQRRQLTYQDLAAEQIALFESFSVQYLQDILQKLDTGLIYDVDSQTVFFLIQQNQAMTLLPAPVHIQEPYLEQCPFMRSIPFIDTYQPNWQGFLTYAAFDTLTTSEKLLVDILKALVHEKHLC